MARQHRPGFQKLPAPPGAPVCVATLACLVILACLPAGGCSRSPADGSVARLTVAVSIQPQAFFTRRIGGDQVDVQVMVSPGQSPHTYDPTGRQLAGLAGARLYLAIGAPMEQSLLPRIRESFPELPIFDTTEGITRLEASANQMAGQAHETDPHVWLSLRQARILAQNTCAALARVDSARATDYQENLAALQAELAALDADITRILEPFRGSELLVYHPAYAYFAADYGLQQVAIEAGGIEPTPRHLAEILEHTRQQDTRVLFVQPESSLPTAQKIAQQMGLQTVILDPLAIDYLDNLRGMALAIRAALERE